MKETRIRIITKAAELFFSLGVKTITMDYIAQQLGMSKKTLYERFANKDELVSVTIDFIADKIEIELNRCVSLDITAIEQLFAINKSIKTIVNNDKNTCYVQLKRFYPQLFSKVITYQKQLIENTVIKNIEKGVKEGLYRKDINIKLSSRIYYNTIITAEEGESFEDFDYTIWQIKDYMMELFIRSVATEKGIIELEKILKN